MTPSLGAAAASASEPPSWCAVQGRNPLRTVGSSRSGTDPVASRIGSHQLLPRFSRRSRLCGVSVSFCPCLFTCAGVAVQSNQKLHVRGQECLGAGFCFGKLDGAHLQRGWGTRHFQHDGARFGFASSRFVGQSQVWRWSLTASRFLVDVNQQWTTLVCALLCDGSLHRGAADADGVVAQTARRRKERTFPKIVGPQWARLVEVGGRWSSETRSFNAQLAKARSKNRHLSEGGLSKFGA